MALHGSLHVITGNGNFREEFVLNSPTFGIHIPANVWSVQYRQRTTLDCRKKLICQTGLSDHQKSINPPGKNGGFFLF